MWKIMQEQKQRGFAIVFDGFLRTLSQVQGKDEGLRTYNHILGLHGVDSWQKFRSTQVARKCVLSLYQRVIEIAPDSPTKIDDEQSAA